MADDVQSVETDQGAAGSDSGYAQYLDSVAPEIREQVEPLFKEFDGNVTKKFQEHAEYRKGWAPYEELGVRDIEPQQLQELLQFAQMANDDKQFDQWLTKVATDRGLFAGDDLDGLDDEEDSSIEERLIEKLSEQINPILERFEKQDEKELVDKATAEIDQTFESLLAEHKDLPENARDTVEALAYRYTDEQGLSAKEVIEKGFSDYLSLIGQAEKGLFQKKSSQPATPEGPGGNAATQDEKITSFGDPRLKQIAAERLKQSA